MKILITGGRDYSNREYVDQVLNEMYIKHKNEFSLVLGGASGVDTFAQDWACFMKVNHHVFYADWRRYGKRAGFLRNKVMANQKPDMAVAFPGGPGTKMMIKICVEKNIPVIRRPIIECGVELWSNENRFLEG